MGMIIDTAQSRVFLPELKIPVRAKAKDQVPKRIDPQSQNEERTINSPLHEAIKEDGVLL